MSADAAAISCAGTVLSQPPISTAAVHRLRGQHRLGVERGEVAIVHRAREQRRLAQRHGGEGERQSAGGEHAALHRLDQLRHRAVAVVVVRAGIDDADHRPVQHRLRVAHRLGEGPAQIQREIADRRSSAVLRARPRFVSVLMPACYAAAATRATRGGSDAGNSAGPYASPRGGAGFATLSLLAQRSDLLQMTCDSWGNCFRYAPGDCVAALREIASLCFGRLLRCAPADCFAALAMTPLIGQPAMPRPIANQPSATPLIGHQLSASRH